MPGPVQDLGYRPWMQTGVSFTDFNDFAYVGYRNVGGNTNEFVINWSNDIATYGPDDMAFRFTREYDFTVPNPPTNGRIDNDFTKSDDMDGRHIARFTPTGEFGLGPNFGYTIDNSAYVRPQSMFHMSSYKQQDTWFQITNQTGTAETAADGLRIGITDTGTAHIKQQEALPLVLYTGAVEDVRIVPASASTLTGNHGMVGIGNFSLDTLDAKLDINGDLRIRTVTQRDTLLQVLVIDSNDHNRVHWRNIGGLGGNATAFNGTSIDTATSQVQLGQDVGDSLNPAMLVNNRQVPMNNFNIQFDGLGVQGANQISVGAPSPIPTLTGDTNLTSKFSTYNEDDLIAGSFVSDEQNFSGSSFGFTSSGDFIRTNMIGVAGIALKKNFDFAVGVYGTAAQANIGGSTLRGVVGQIRFGGNKTKAIGVHGIGENTKGGQNYGGYFEALGSPNNNIGVFCTAPVTPSTFPPTPPSNLALFADGDVFVSGTAYLANPAVVSDQQFKTNIDSLQNALQIITQLNPRNFEYVASLSPKLNFPLGEQYGFIAQEVEQVLPTIISEGIIPEVYDSLGNIVESAIQYKSLNYNALIAILTKGMQEQQINIDSLHHVVNEQDSINNDLETRLAFLESCIRNANICEEGNRTINQNPNSGINQKSIELINTNGIILDQNLPNPFAENTVINYNIPTEVAEAKLLFYDLNGRIIKELVIEERGESKLTVYGSNLKTGVYTYSLIADGELIATKKMVKK